MFEFATIYVNLFARSTDSCNLPAVKVKVSLEQATKAQTGEQIYTSTLLSTLALDGGWSAPRPGRFTPAKDPVPIV